MRKPLSFLLLLLPIALFAAPACAQERLTIDALLARFASLPGLEARFREEKRIALLAVPLTSEGRIYFAPPGRLLRRVTSPEPSAALIADGHLTMRQGDRTERLAIGDNPVLRGFVDSFRAVLAGDRAALDRFYEARLEPRPEEGDSGWQLTLRPRAGDLQRFLREITMRGNGTTIREMRMLEVSGDETRTEFSEVRTDRRWTDAERARTFRVD